MNNTEKNQKRKKNFNKEGSNVSPFNKIEVGNCLAIKKSLVTFARIV